MTDAYHYGECPNCGFSVIVKTVPPKMASNCGVCAESEGLDVWMSFREARPDDVAKGLDQRAAKGAS